MINVHMVVRGPPGRRMIATMPGSPREEAFTALLDWWGTSGPEPGFETYDNPVAGRTGITDGIIRQVRDAVPMLRRAADQQSRKHRRDVLALLRGLDTGWTGHDLPQKRSRRTSRTNDPAWPGTLT